MIDKGRIYCAQIQAAWGTPETDISGTDFMEVLEDSNIVIVNENDNNPTVSGGFGQNEVVIGAARTEATMNFNMRSFGATPAPDWCTFAQAAGFVLAGTNPYTLVPAAIGVHKDITVWMYNGGRVIKAGNMMFDWEISADINKKAIISFTNGKGTLIALPTALASPTVTKSGAFTPVVLPMTKTILGSSAYSPLSFSIKGNSTIEQYVTGTSFGYGKSEITNREMEFEIVAYAELPATADPYTAMRAGGGTELTIEWGKTGEHIEITTDSANIKDIKEDKSGNLITWTISGLILDDDLTITVNKV